MVYVPTSMFTPRGPVIKDDRGCPNCKYNLKGLREGQACPECGFASGVVLGDDEGSSIGGFWGKVLSLLESGHTPGIGSSLTEAPRSYLHQLSFACRVMQAALVLCLAFPAAALLAIKLGADRSSIFLALSMSFLFPACLWAWGTWVMSAPRRTRELKSNLGKEWSSTRRAIRSTQVLWMIGAAVFSVRAWANSSNVALVGPEWAWLVAQFVPLTVAFIGLTWVTLYASKIAEWANDIDMADRLRLASLGVFFAPPIILLAVGVTFTFDVALMQFFAAAMGVLASLLPLAWLVQLVFATMQFISMAKWAQVNADTIAERDERMAAKAQQNYAKANRSKEAPGSAPVAPTLNRAHAQAKPQAARSTSGAASIPQKSAASTQGNKDTFELAPPYDGTKSPPRIVRHDKAP